MKAFAGFIVWLLATAVYTAIYGGLAWAATELISTEAVDTPIYIVAVALILWASIWTAVAVAAAASAD